LESHADHDHPDDANPTGNTRNISTTKCVPEPLCMATDSRDTSR